MADEITERAVTRDGRAHHVHLIRKQFRCARCHARITDYLAIVPLDVAPNVTVSLDNKCSNCNWQNRLTVV